LLPPSRILAVDAGNSRVKWALHEGGSFSHEGSCGHGELESLEKRWAALALPDAVVIANVAGEAIGAYIARCCKPWGLVPTWVRAQQSQCGVTNTYDNPSQLGPDRWAALIGAHEFQSGNCIVVCMGTATTIDALTGTGTFLGGMILPGLDMMHASLATRTARLGTDRGELVAFPHATKDAITTGAIRATCGAIGHMVEEMRLAGYEDVKVVLTGGAASSLSSACKHSMVLREKLVMRGLVCIGRADGRDRRS
jgi:type III pantothenate kinase